MWCSAQNPNPDITDVTESLNGQIAEGDCGVYCGGGRGVIIRNPYDAYERATSEHGWLVVPSTFWHNDIAVANTIFPSTGGSDPGNFATYPDGKWGVTSYNPDCPNQRTNGFFDTGADCLEDPGTGDNSPWRYAATGYIIGDSMANLFFDWDNIQGEDWGWGVFYATDSNSVDYRCRWLDAYQIYDCPPDPSGFDWWKGGYVDLSGTWYEDETKAGPGVFPAGNPEVNDDNGGGTGCHFDKGGSKTMDQTDGFAADGTNLVKDSHCQCNYDLGGDWSAWVQQWIDYSTPKPNLPDDEWWLGTGGRKAPFRALDEVACWVNNLRDMINLQNMIWWKRWDWANQIAPETNWQADDANTQWAYWGWNEIPMSLDQLTDPSNHQAIFIHLPTSICGNGGGDDSVGCLGDGHHYALENDLDNWVNGPDGFGYLVPGEDNMAGRPGSYVVFVREWYDQDNDRWRKYFFCENWQGPMGKYKIVSRSMGTNAADDPGACYIDYGSMYHRFYGSATNVGKLQHTMDEIV